MLVDQAAKDAARHTPAKVPLGPQPAPVMVAQTAPPVEAEAKTTADKDTSHYTKSVRLHLRELQEAVSSYKKAVITKGKEKHAIAEVDLPERKVADQVFMRHFVG
ncbi:hypothetical protein NDU88_002900 [Pleurodeles waltl]|uniref:Uncharacterized protein n=1 Tax=Pleurodeles waltl TaxID=8319 RepID=A0AAV7KX26_PLEWA|nr:hypothetical protein NDU88_002900 [Pleurodeles waltl]